MIVVQALLVVAGIYLLSLSRGVGSCVLFSLAFTITALVGAIGGYNKLRKYSRAEEEYLYRRADILRQLD